MYKVLIVDDEPIVREGLKTIIHWEKYGFCVCGEASNGLEGIQIIEKLNPHLVLADIRMPEVCGLKMISIMQSRLFYPKIIILTGYSDFEYAQKAINHGVVAYLLKPIDELELIKHVEKVHQLLSDEVLIKEINEKEILEVFGIAKVKIENADHLKLESVIDKMKAYIASNQNEKIRLKDLAHKFNYDPCYLGKLFKNATGLSFNDYMEKEKMGRAAELLKKGYKVSFVSESLGYVNPEYFLLQI